MQNATPSANATTSRLDRLLCYHEADPGNVQLLRDIAREGISTQTFATALMALDKLSAAGESQANDEAAAIHVLLKMGHIGDACERALHAHQTWPDDEAVRLEGTRALCNARRFDEALTLAGQAPFSDPALAQMGGELCLQALWHTGDLEQALALGAELVAQWPDNPRILATYSALLYDEERSEEAFAAARQAYALSPVHAYQALHVLASEQLLKGDIPGALAMLTQARQVRTDDGRIWLIQGSAKLAAGQTEEAICDLKKAIAIFPDHPGSYLTLAWAYIAQRQLDDAQATVESAIAASPAFAESHGTLSVVYAMKGLTEEARQSIRRATLLDKDGFSARYAQSLLDGTAPEDVPELFKQVMTRVGLK